MASLKKISEYIENEFIESRIVIPDEDLFFKVYKKSGIKSRKSLIHKWLLALKEIINDKDSVRFTDVTKILVFMFKDVPIQSVEIEKRTNDYFLTFTKFFTLFSTYLIEDHISDVSSFYKSRLDNLDALESELILIYGENIFPQEYKEFFKLKLQNSINKKSITNPELTYSYFQWQGTDQAFQKLYDLLIENNMQIDYEDFKSLFAKEHNHKVNWSSPKSNMRQIAHLFHSLCDSNLIYNSQSRYINKIITDRLLINGKSISLPDLKKSYSHFKNRGKLKSQQIQAIDNIIQSLKK